jgi:hypothetical protein
MAEETSGSPERVALSLLQIIQHAKGPNADKSEDAILALYAKCRRAAYGKPVTDS